MDEEEIKTQEDDVIDQPGNDDQDIKTKDEVDGNTKLIREMRKAFKEQSKELKRYKDAEAKKAEEDRLAQGKYEELLKEKELKLEETNRKLREVLTEKSVDAELNNVRPEFKKYIARDVKELLEYDDDGNVTNLSEAIEQVKGDNPEAFKANGKVVPQTTTTGGENITTMTKQKALEILNSGDNRAYAKYMKEIHAALSQ